MRESQKSSAAARMATCISVGTIGGLQRVMAKFSSVRRAASIVAALVLIFGVLALQTAAHVAQIDKLCAVEVSLADGEQIPDNSADDGGFDAALLERAIEIAPMPVGALRDGVPDSRTILHSSIIGIPTTGPPTFRT